MTKRLTAYILLAVLILVIFFSLGSISSIDGYYPVDVALAREYEIAKGAEVIATIENDSEYIVVAVLEDDVILWRCETKHNMFGERYKLSQKRTTSVQYDKITIENTDIWSIFKPGFFDPKANLHDLYYTVVEKSEKQKFNAAMCYEYEHDGKLYCFLATFEEPAL